jgi:hypothetical protein
MDKALASFTVTRTGDNYVLHIEDESGETLDLNATYEQLDIISEAIDEQLDVDEDSALSVEEDEG